MVKAKRSFLINPCTSELSGVSLVKHREFVMTIEEDLLDRFALLHAPQNVAIPLVALRRHWPSSDGDLTRAVDTLVKKGLLVVTGDVAALTPEGYALVSKQPIIPPPFSLRHAPQAA